MFGLGFIEICVIAIAALLVVGPQKLPKLMQQLGGFMMQMRRMSHDVRSSFDAAVHEAEREIEREQQKTLDVYSEDKAKAQENPPDGAVKKPEDI